jgi:hypothetical protein
MILLLEFSPGVIASWVLGLLSLYFTVRFRRLSIEDLRKERRFQADKARDSLDTRSSELDTIMAHGKMHLSDEKIDLEKVSGWEDLATLIHQKLQEARQLITSYDSVRRNIKIDFYDWQRRFEQSHSELTWSVQKCDPVLNEICKKAGKRTNASMGARPASTHFSQHR